MSADEALAAVAGPQAGAAAQDGQAGALAMRLFLAGLAAAELMSVHLGQRLGLYRALAGGPTTAAELAGRAGIGARYAREWLEQQAAAGIVVTSDDRFELPDGHRQVLVDDAGPLSTSAMAALAATGIPPVLSILVDAYRAGRGVPSDAYGAAFREAQAGLNRPVFARELVRWVRATMPDVHQRLRRPGAAVADVGCGAGWSTIALAKSYPAAEVHGLDVAADALARARANAERAGAARIAFTVQDVTASVATGRYDLVCLLDALHDMPYPVRVLEACRRMLAPGGCLLLAEPKAAERFTAPADEVERFLYAISVLHCLPVGLCGPDAAGTGAVIRPGTVRQYGLAAGFSRIAELPVSHRFYRLYRLD